MQCLHSQSLLVSPTVAQGLVVLSTLLWTHPLFFQPRSIINDVKTSYCNMPVDLVPMISGQAGRRAGDNAVLINNVSLQIQSRNVIANNNGMSMRIIILKNYRSICSSLDSKVILMTASTIESFQIYLNLVASF
jgi:hypothetical protein